LTPGETINLTTTFQAANPVNVNSTQVVAVEEVERNDGIILRGCPGAATIVFSQPPPTNGGGDDDDDDEVPTPVPPPPPPPPPPPTPVVLFLPETGLRDAALGAEAIGGGVGIALIALVGAGLTIYFYKRRRSK
jgi:hypothetical protein